MVAFNPNFHIPLEFPLGSPINLTAASGAVFREDSWAKRRPGLGLHSVHLSALNGPFTMRYWFSDQPCFLRSPLARRKPRARIARFLASVATWLQAHMATLQLAKIGRWYRAPNCAGGSRVSPIFCTNLPPRQQASRERGERLRGKKPFDEN